MDTTTTHERRSKPASVTPPTRPLEWGDINILHTTDTHGWLLGHQKSSPPEPNYSADFGEFASFVAHMKQIAMERDVDLLLVDSGDLHDGTGLIDAFPPGGVDAHDANEFFTELPYDILAIGNHELYIYENALDMHKNFAPRYPGRYLSSNVNITIPDANGNLVSVPVGNRFAKFKTRKGRKVTSFGVLYDFTGNAKNTTVQKVEDMVKEQWFAEAITEEPDLFLLVGHMPITKDKWPFVFDAIRAKHPTTPILIFGGHTHIRDCVQLDGRSMSLESGRYMETLGWLSAKLPHKKSTGNMTFSRRYLDPNRLTYEFHTRRKGRDFDTKGGRSITQGLLDLAKKFDISFLFGTAPQDYTLSRSEYPSKDSALSLFIEKAAPVALAVNNTRASIPNIIISNSGGIRFDIFQGPFTKNDQIVVSPFTDAFLYISNVTAGLANKVLPALNNAGAPGRRSPEYMEELWGRGYVEGRYQNWLKEMDRRDGEQLRAAANLTLGYVTQDACPGVGDDVLHAPLPYFEAPDYIASAAPNVTDSTPIDLVFVDFIASQVLKILNSVQSDKVYSQADVQTYSPTLASQVLGVYAQSAWN